MGSHDLLIHNLKNIWLKKMVTIQDNIFFYNNDNVQYILVYSRLRILFANKAIEGKISIANFTNDFPRVLNVGLNSGVHFSPKDQLILSFFKAVKSNFLNRVLYYFVSMN